MKTEYFDVLSTILSPKSLLEQVNSRYRLQGLECKLWSMGLNDVYQIQTSEEQYYLRVSHANRFSRKDYEEEITIILELQKRNINVCKPVKQKDDTYLWEITALEGKRYAVLFEKVKQDASRNLYEMGKIVAKIHEASDAACLKVSREPIEYNQLIQHPLQAVCESRQLEIEWIEDIKSKSIEMWKCITETIPKETPYYGYCHGDVHSGNLYFYKDRPQIFDFDCMGDAYRAYELAVYLWDESSINEQFINSDQWKEYISGYEAVRRLTKEERDSLPAFAALRQVWFMGLMVDTTKINNGWEGINRYFLEKQVRRFQFFYDLWKSQGEIKNMFGC
ncbi:MAG: hypothetical protein E7256_03940 [Lachnospiraceae bacterium]|nr:hypothetical protein [Lachnospiraceae bacterium]